MYIPSTAIASAGAAIMGIQRRNKATWSLSVNVRWMGDSKKRTAQKVKGVIIQVLYGLREAKE